MRDDAADCLGAFDRSDEGRLPAERSSLDFRAVPPAFVALRAILVQRGPDLALAAVQRAAVGRPEAPLRHHRVK